MSEPDDPPPKKYALKDAESERVNAPRGTDAPSADHDGLPMFFLPAMCMTGYSGALTWLMFGVMGRY